MVVFTQSVGNHTSMSLNVVSIHLVATNEYTFKRRTESPYNYVSFTQNASIMCTEICRFLRW